MMAFRFRSRKSTLIIAFMVADLDEPQLSLLEGEVHSIMIVGHS